VYVFVSATIGEARRIEKKARRRKAKRRRKVCVMKQMLIWSYIHVHYRKRQEEALRLERELQEAEEIARKEAEAEAAALTEILNLDNALQVHQHNNIISTYSCYSYVPPNS